MNGERALEFSRSRLSTSDSDRSHRQELVLVAMLHRLHSLEIDTRLVRLAAAIKDGFRTKLRPAYLQGLDRMVTQTRLQAASRLSIDESNFLRKVDISGPFYALVPKDGNYDALRGYLATALGG